MQKNDVFAVMPTGGGKSLTFQLPAVISSGVTVVIMPLISLIYDQVQYMQNLGVNAVSLTGGIKASERREILKMLGSDNPPKLVFLTPEMINKSEAFRAVLA